MNTCMNWNNEDIEQLRLHFLKGLPIKLIARTLSRSPGAVNKALSRFNIRTPRRFKEKKTLLSFKKVTSSLFQRKKKCSERERKCPSSWTSFSKIVEWLNDQGTECVPLSEDNFLIQNRPYTKLQVVMYANKLRLERGYAIFLVENITW